jgi:hypothetical protein
MRITVLFIIGKILFSYFDGAGADTGRITTWNPLPLEQDSL